MLIRLLEIDYIDDGDPYTGAKFLAAYREPNYAEFVKMLHDMKDNGEEFQIAVDDEWYIIDTYVFSFPKNDGMLPCINVYVM